MSDQDDTRRVRAFVAGQVQAQGWGPLDALAWSEGKDRDELFLDAVMLTRLCSDPIARDELIHRVLHRGYGLRGHVGPELVTHTQRQLGISDARAAHLIRQFDQRVQVLDRLSAAGSP
jgi:hypothetical protein